MNCSKCGREKVQIFRNGKKAGRRCPACRNAYFKKYRASNPERQLGYQLWTLYRLRLPAYQQMLAEQDGRCATCGIQAAETDGGLVVDHDHACCPDRTGSCGKCVRGLLCRPCNLALGFAVDDPDRLEALAAYVRKWVA